MIGIVRVALDNRSGPADHGSTARSAQKYGMIHGDQGRKRGSDLGTKTVLYERFWDVGRFIMRREGIRSRTCIVTRMPR